MLRKTALFLTASALALACNIPDPDDFLPPEDPEPTPPPANIEEPPVAVGFAITSIEPSAGEPRGMELVELRGGGFKEGARVFFGGSEALNVTVTGEGLIYAVTPPHAPAAVPVRIVNIDTTFTEADPGFF